MPATPPLYYNRARYLDVRQGRFWGMDLAGGSGEDPTSLHKFLYANASPVTGIDPSGLATSYDGYGYEAERKIRDEYEADHIFDLTIYGVATGVGRNKSLKPDIFNVSGFRFLEIKPMSEAGIADAVATHALYSANFADTLYRFDPKWIPPSQPIPVLDRMMMVVNVGGILLYSSDLRNQRDANQIKSLSDARSFLRDLASGQMRLYGNLALGGLAISSIAGAIAAQQAALNQSLGVAIQNSVMGKAA